MRTLMQPSKTLADGPRKYDSCFLKWYSESRYTYAAGCFELINNKIEYLRGNSSEDECAPLFKKYKSCLTVRICLLGLLPQSIAHTCSESSKGERP